MKNYFIGLIIAVLLIVLAVGARVIEGFAVATFGATWTYSVIALLIVVVCIEIAFATRKVIRRTRRFIR